MLQASGNYVFSCMLCLLEVVVKYQVNPYQREGFGKVIMLETMHEDLTS